MDRMGGSEIGRRIRWWGLGAGLGALLVLMALLMANGVDTAVTDDDRVVIAGLEVDEQCRDIDGFDAELKCVAAVQNSVFERFPSTKDAFQKGITGHRARDYAERGYGSCYDRATLIEQALRHYDFEVRRVALYERQDRPWNYLKPGIRSHALSEVTTSRGDMVIESVEPMIGVDEDHDVYAIADVREGLHGGEIDDQTFGVDVPENFFDGDFVYAYGVYSRHGYFFEPHIPVPEVDWRQFRLW